GCGGSSQLRMLPRRQGSRPNRRQKTCGIVLPLIEPIEIASIFVKALESCRLTATAPAAISRDESSRWAGTQATRNAPPPVQRGFRQMDQNMKTFSQKPAEVTKKWVLIDATDLVVGRLAALVASRLRGK